MAKNAYLKLSAVVFIAAVLSIAVLALNNSKEIKEFPGNLELAEYNETPIYLAGRPIGLVIELAVKHPDLGGKFENAYINMGRFPGKSGVPGRTPTLHEKEEWRVTELYKDGLTRMRLYFYGDYIFPREKFDNAGSIYCTGKKTADLIEFYKKKQADDQYYLWDHLTENPNVSFTFNWSYETDHAPLTLWQKIEEFFNPSRSRLHSFEKKNIEVTIVNVKKLKNENVAFLGKSITPQIEKRTSYLSNSQFWRDVSQAVEDEDLIKANFESCLTNNYNNKCFCHNDSSAGSPH